jgi:hypothetical protein
MPYNVDLGALEVQGDVPRGTGPITLPNICRNSSRTHFRISDFCPMPNARKKNEEEGIGAMT